MQGDSCAERPVATCVADFETSQWHYETEPKGLWRVHRRVRTGPSAQLPAHGGSSATLSVFATAFLVAGGLTLAAEAAVEKERLWSPGCSHASGTVTCNLGSLPQGSNATVVIRVTPQAKGTFTNRARVVGNEFDPNTANNSATARTLVLLAEGSAFGEQVRSGLVNSGPLPVVTRTTPGTSSNSVLAANVPGVLQAGVLKVSTTVGPGVFVTSTASAATNQRG